MSRHGAPPRARAGVAVTALIVAATATGAGVATAEPASASAAPHQVVDASLHYTMALGPKWRPAPVTPPAAADWTRPETRQMLALVRVRYPTAPAWRGDRAFFDEVEDGVREEERGYHRLERRRFKLQRVPVMDLRFSCHGAAGREVVTMRFLFYHRYTLAAAIATPARAARARRKARAVVASFQPYFAAGP